jgi:hypothetical protein
MVCRSAAGYYVGAHCDRHGPYTRYTGYYATSEEAGLVLAGGGPWIDYWLQ